MIAQERFSRLRDDGPEPAFGFGNAACGGGFQAREGKNSPMYTAPAMKNRAQAGKVFLLLFLQKKKTPSFPYPKSGTGNGCATSMARAARRTRSSR
jgi:hypothetical protein